MELIGYPYEDLIRFLFDRYGKSRYYGDALFRRLQKEGRMDLREAEAFAKNPGFAAQLEEDFPLTLPEVAEVNEEAGTVKAVLRLADGELIETVLIPMSTYNTLCISTQAGCARACLFCETGRTGFRRNLTAAEIISQLYVMRHRLGRSVEKLVFMGMGEPTDNLDAVVRAMDVMADQNGMRLPLSCMTLSTVGNVAGIRRLAEMARQNDGRYYHTLRLAVSLNAPDQELRARLMPVARTRGNALPELLDALEDYPLPPRSRIFFEYAVIPGINDAPQQADQLISLIQSRPRLCGSVNLIRYNPTRAGAENFYRAFGAKGLSAAAAAASRYDHEYLQNESERSLRMFFDKLLAAEIPVRIRRSRGSGVNAACGQLSGELRSR